MSLMLNNSFRVGNEIACLFLRGLTKIFKKIKYRIVAIISRFAGFYPPTLFTNFHKKR